MITESLEIERSNKKKRSMSCRDMVCLDPSRSDSN